MLRFGVLIIQNPSVLGMLQTQVGLLQPACTHPVLTKNPSTSEETSLVCLQILFTAARGARVSETRTENSKNISSKLMIGLQAVRRTREKLPVLFCRIKSIGRETDRWCGFPEREASNSMRIQCKVISVSLIQQFSSLFCTDITENQHILPFKSSLP